MLHREADVPDDDGDEGDDNAQAEQNSIYYGDQTQLINDPFLTNLMLAVNTDYKFISCLNRNCGIVLSDKWFEHLSRYHKTKPTLADIVRVNEILAQCPLKREVGSNTDQTPVQGLLLQKGFACSLCVEDQYCSTTVNRMTTHTRQIHPTERVAREACHFQCSGKKGTKNFRVSVPCCPFLEMVP